MTKSRFIVLLVLLTAGIRLFPHLPNFLPITAICIFAGAHLGNKKHSLALIFVSMLISDMILGLHSTMLFTYPALTLTVLLGSLLKKTSLVRRNHLNLNSIAELALVSVAGSLLFFTLTNFGVWLLQDLYSKDLAGLINCFVMALPFWKNSLQADVGLIQYFSMLIR